MKHSAPRRTSGRWAPLALGTSVVLAGALLVAVPSDAPASVRALTPSRAIAVPAAVIPAEAAVPLRTPAGQYTVMSYNITDASRTPEYAGLADHPGDFDWSVRGPVIVDWIKRVSPDLLGLQEASPIRDSDGEQIDLLKQKLRGYTWVFPHRSTALAFRTSKFTKLDKGVIRVSYKGKDGSEYNRYAPWVKLRTNTGKKLLYVNLHGEYGQTEVKAEARSAGWTRLVDGLAKINPRNRLPVVITGDFNARDDETRPVFRDHLTKLAAAGLVNASTAAKQQETPLPGVTSFNGFGARFLGRFHYQAVRRSAVGGNLDYVWTGGAVKPVSWEVYLGPKVTWRLVDGWLVPYVKFIPSDHWPVVAKVRLVPAKSR
ncbi:MAG: endonuclease/exonuclease/phosphatase family protein [Propionibacteriaceae bacterium]|nr:endonuclease/exonuclease/phosphatase family protein [Propionibacteriaceae bacterium]